MPISKSVQLARKEKVILIRMTFSVLFYGKRLYVEKKT